MKQAIQPKPGRPRWSAGRIAGLAAITVLIGLLTCVTGCQRRFIYLCRPYSADVLETLPAWIVAIDYQTSAGAQKAYYIKPLDSPETPPDRLWVLIGGNGSLALGWVGEISSPPDRRAGFYLLDYPGYGLNEGEPTRASINEGSLAAFDALAARFKMTRAELASRTSLFCHSLGAAAGLEFATRLDPPPKKIILFAPFTSLYDMARQLTCWPVCCLLLDRFDNQKRLDELAARSPMPEVHIFHGDRDELVPVEMGRALAASHPGLVQYHEVPNFDHVGVIGGSNKIWKPLMAAAPRS